jgi:DNA adenine methylase
MPSIIPHPIPYQGSKRELAPIIGKYVPSPVNVWFEAFAGSAAMTIWAASKGVARQYVISDSFEPMMELWNRIVYQPGETARRYAEVWNGQLFGDSGYFNRVRDRYNLKNDPVDLLYLTCRCVKNAVRFNKNGQFTQSVDKRRMGMQPQKMAAHILGASTLLRGRSEIRTGDWLETTKDATPGDFIYLDPPYLGTTIGRDKRYADQMPRDRLIEGLRSLIARRIPLALSYDGMTGQKEYGPPLPDDLELTRLLIHAGASSQATLNGRRENTIESLYVTPDLNGPTLEFFRKTRENQRVLPL